MVLSIPAHSGVNIRKLTKEIQQLKRWDSASSQLFQRCKRSTQPALKKVRQVVGKKHPEFLGGQIWEDVCLGFSRPLNKFIYFKCIVSSLYLTLESEALDLFSFFTHCIDFVPLLPIFKIVGYCQGPAFNFLESTGMTKVLKMKLLPYYFSQTILNTKPNYRM